MILIYLAIIIIVSYLGVVLWKNKDIPKSISMTYYLWPTELSWIFRLTMILVPLLVLPHWLEISKDQLKFLTFLCCGGMIFIGCSPNLHIKLENNVHYMAAYICCGAGILWQILSGLYWPLCIWGILGFIGYLWKKKIIWWVEILTIGSIICNLLI